MDKITQNVDRDKMCGTKVRYVTRAFAKTKAANIYVCPYCRQWHSSRNPLSNNRFNTILRQEREKDDRLYLFAWNQDTLQQVYNDLIDNGAQVKFVYRDGRYEIRIK